MRTGITSQAFLLQIQQGFMAFKLTPPTHNSVNPP